MKSPAQVGDSHLTALKLISYICIIVSKNELNKNRKYNPFISILLLALYAFVATPIQSWHQHEYAATSSNSSSEQKQSVSIASAPSQSAEEDCQICSHQYSSCDSIGSILFSAPSFGLTSKEGHYYHSVSPSPLFSFSNKGPPVLA